MDWQSHKSPRWYFSEIEHHLNKLRTLHKKFRSHPSETTYQKLFTGEQCLETLLLQAKVDFESNLFTNSSKPYHEVFCTCAEGIQ